MLGLLGENGAGKTTLMNILSGLYRPDSGQILVDGEPRAFHDPAEAIHAGIGMVHQHFMLVPVFDVVESVALGAEPVRGAVGTFDRATTEQILAGLGEMGYSISPASLRLDDLTGDPNGKVPKSAKRGPWWSADSWRSPSKPSAASM